MSGVDSAEMADISGVESRQGPNLERTTRDYGHRGPSDQVEIVSDLFLFGWLLP